MRLNSRQRVGALILLGTAILLVFLIPRPVTTTPEPLSASVASFSGEAFACEHGRGCTTPAISGTKVYTDGEAWTGATGKADLQTDSVVFRLDPLSKLQFTDVTDAVTQVTVWLGRLFVSHDPQGRDQIYVQAGRTLTTALDTQFSVVVDDAVGTVDGALDRGVYIAVPPGGGQVIVHLGTLAQRVVAGEELYVPPAATALPAPQPISAEEIRRWNEVSCAWQGIEAVLTPGALPPANGCGAPQTDTPTPVPPPAPTDSPVPPVPDTPPVFPSPPQPPVIVVPPPIIVVPPPVIVPQPVTVTPGPVTETPTHTLTPTATPTNTPTDTPRVVTVTVTLPPPVVTVTLTPTNTPTNTLTPTNTPTDTPPPDTWTPTVGWTPTNTPTLTWTPTWTPTNTPAWTPSWTPTNTPTDSPTPSINQPPDAGLYRGTWVTAAQDKPPVREMRIDAGSSRVVVTWLQDCNGDLCTLGTTNALLGEKGVTIDVPRYGSTVLLTLLDTNTMQMTGLNRNDLFTRNSIGGSTAP
jgi:hypothetical protein